MISLIICHRNIGNTNSNLNRLVSSLISKTSNFSNVEILIKSDDDDCVSIPESPITSKHIITPRRRGYADLHLGYQDLRQLVNENTIFVGAIADDFECVLQDWDKAILNSKDGFVLEANQHYFPVENLSSSPVDPCPFWERAVLDVCDWDWGCFATDMWTYLILNRLPGLARFSGDKMFNRHVDLNIDWVNGSRWHNERKEMLDIVQSREYQSKIEEQVCKIKSLKNLS